MEHDMKSRIFYLVLAVIFSFFVFHLLFENHQSSTDALSVACETKQNARSIRLPAKLITIQEIDKNSIEYRCFE